RLALMKPKRWPKVCRLARRTATKCSFSRASIGMASKRRTNSGRRLPWRSVKAVDVLGIKMRQFRPLDGLERSRDRPIVSAHEIKGIIDGGVKQVGRLLVEHRRGGGVLLPRRNAVGRFLLLIRRLFLGRVDAL